MSLPHKCFCHAAFHGLLYFLWHSAVLDIVFFYKNDFEWFEGHGIAKPDNAKTTFWV